MRSTNGRHYTLLIETSKIYLSYYMIFEPKLLYRQGSFYDCMPVLSKNHSANRPRKALLQEDSFDLCPIGQPGAGLVEVGPAREC